MGARGLRFFLVAAARCWVVFFTSSYPDSFPNSPLLSFNVCNLEPNLFFVLQNDLWELLPASSRQASRTSPSRPLTAPFNLRGRHARVTPSNEASSSNEPTARASLRQRVNDVSHAHTYSRDHRRILRARVSVQAEIQHQYNRLQQLQRERRRLEDRLRQLQTDRASLRAGGAARENRGLHNDLYALEQEVFNDYHEINEALSNRIRSRMSQVRNAALEVSQIPPPADSRSHIPPPADPLFHIPPPADPQSQNPPPTSPQPSSASWWAQARSASNPPRAVVANALDPAVILFGAPRSPSITMDTGIIRVKCTKVELLHFAN